MGNVAVIPIFDYSRQGLGTFRVGFYFYRNQFVLRPQEKVLFQS